MVHAGPRELDRQHFAIADRDGTVHFLYCLEYARCFYIRSDDDGRTFAYETGGHSWTELRVERDPGGGLRGVATVPRDSASFSYGDISWRMMTAPAR